MKRIELPEPSSSENKICYKCKIEKPKSKFCINRGRKDGYNPYCKDCEKKKRDVLNAKGYFKEYAENNREKINERAKKYYHENPEKFRARKRAYDATEHGKKVKAENAHKYWIKTRDDPELKIKRAEYMKKYREAHLEEHRLDSTKQREKFPDETKAKSMVNHAIRNGRLEREPCEMCGAEPSHAHHDDYNKPLDVRWLCKDCHAKWHRDNEPIRKRKE